jgi:NADPH:quinone reductase-like Zn-dependent oxidoreductase
MSGILIEATGGLDVLQWKTDLPVPELKEGEVLVKNEYVGVNFIDTYAPPLSSITYRLYKHPPPFLL